MDKGSENRRRVKLYVLNPSRHWDDRGTGHVSAMYSERLSGMSLFVRDEQTSVILLESKIDSETSYQKQQETLIVWSENDSDMALSFQEKAGCEEVWGKICQVQGKDPSVEITQDNLDDDDEEESPSGAAVTGYGQDVASASNAGAGVVLPPCEISKLDKICEVVQLFMAHPHQREKLANAIESEDYIKKLLELFKKCEDLEYSDGLQQLFSVMKSILMLNRNALYEVLFSDDCIEDVLGCLECDPTPSGAPPKRHRHYIREIAKFKEVIPLENPELYAKIQQIYRVQYIQDVILPSPSVFEDNILNTLQSFVFFSKMEIVNMIQDDQRFLKALFAQLSSSETSLPKRRDAILFLKEFCQFSQTLQPPARENFFRMLMTFGILPAIQAALDVNDSKTRAALVDVFTYIVELHPFVVREYSMAQAQKETNDKNLFFVHIIRQTVVDDPDPQAAGAMQVLTIMRLLLDPENMLNSPNKTEKTEFLSFFYKRCLQYLIEPVFEVTAAGVLPKTENIRIVHILNLILEFLSYCVEHHTYHIKNFIIQRDLLKSVLVLLQSAHQFLVVAVIRFLRKIVGLNDDFYSRYIEKGDHFKPVIEVFLRNGRRYNLLNSSILELFEHIRVEDIRRLIVYVIGTYWDRLEAVTYSQTFKLLHIRYGIHTSPSPESSSHHATSRTGLLDRPVTPDALEPGAAARGAQLRLGSAGGTRRYRRDDRDMDQDEESWFENDEQEENGDTGTETSDEVIDHGNAKGELSVASSVPSVGKLIPLTPVKSLPHIINTAPPVKRPTPDDADDDDNPFSGPSWKFSGRSSGNRKIARSPSPSTFKVSLNTAPPAPDLYPSRSPPSLPVCTTNGPVSNSIRSDLNHTSHLLSTPSTTTTTTGSSWEMVNNNDSSTRPPLSPLGKLSPVSANIKPSSPSLVDYPDDDADEPHNGSMVVDSPSSNTSPSPDRQEIAS